MLWTAQRLCEAIRPLFQSLDVPYLDIAHLNSLSNDVMLDINVFRSSVCGWVAGEPNCRLIIAVESHGTGLIDT